MWSQWTLDPLRRLGLRIALRWQRAHGCLVVEMRRDEEAENGATATRGERERPRALARLAEHGRAVEMFLHGRDERFEGAGGLGRIGMLLFEEGCRPIGRRKVSIPLPYRDYAFSGHRQRAQVGDVPASFVARLVAARV